MCLLSIKNSHLREIACWKHIAIPQNVKLYALCILRYCDKSSRNGLQKALWNRNWGHVLCPQLVKHMGVLLKHLDPVGKHMQTHLAWQQIEVKIWISHPSEVCKNCRLTTTPHPPPPQHPSVALLKFVIHKLACQIISGSPLLLKRHASASSRKKWHHIDLLFKTL